MRLLVLALVVVAFGALPLLVRRTDRLLHLFVAFATGFFLGVVFLHLLPDVAHMADVRDLGSVAAAERAGVQPTGLDRMLDQADGTAVEDADPGKQADAALFGHRHRRSLLWACVLVGVVGLYLLEALLIGGDASDRGRHLTVSWASLLGLCIHAFTSGMGLAAAETQPGLSDPVFLSVLAHKGPEAFSLATVFLLAGFAKSRILLIVCLFSLVAPVGALLGRTFVDGLSPDGVLVLIALATGTFLFVALCDLLPEVFHHREDVLPKVALLAGGVGLSILIEGVTR